ncbi:MAG: GldG family protein [Treponema sp.]|jgi:ABC-type uncharacterized transport system involved in gliding motility auxiliary subunit|nr:GldG family protein [Treponema sp.]
MTRRQTVTITALSIIAFVLGLLVAGRLWFRLDLTRNRAYTISQASRELYAEIPEQVRITYYLSDKLKTVHPLPGEIVDLLQEYAAYSRGKIRLSVRDPAKARLTETVEKIGIMPQQIQSVEQDQTSVSTVYTGIVIEYLDQVEVLPVVFSLDTLEYDLTSRIRSLVRGNERQLGVIVTGNPQRWSENYGYLMNSLTLAGYRIRLLTPGMDIPDTLPVLAVLDGVESLDDAALYQIDRYIQTGGKVLFTVKGVHVDIQDTLEVRLVEDRGLLAMLSSYGVTVLPEIAMDRSALTMQYQTRMPNGALQLRITRNYQWIRVLEENGNPKHPVSSRFGGVDMFWASPLELNPPPQVDADFLFTSTNEGWSMREPFYTDPSAPPYFFEKDAAETKGRKILGVSLSGLFPSWMRDKPKPVREDIEEELPGMPAGTKPARLIIIGDTEFATSFMGVSGGQLNLDFLLKAVDWLGNDDDIIGIRNRDSRSGRLDRIIDPLKRSRAMLTAQVTNIVLMPLVVIIAGILIALRRRSKARLHTGNSGSDIKENPDVV